MFVMLINRCRMVWLVLRVGIWAGGLQRPDDLFAYHTTRAVIARRPAGSES
jgi:hypothetical protein